MTRWRGENCPGWSRRVQIGHGKDVQNEKNLCNFGHCVCGASAGFGGCIGHRPVGRQRSLAVLCDRLRRCIHLCPRSEAAEKKTEDEMQKYSGGIITSEIISPTSQSVKL